MKKKSRKIVTIPCGIALIRRGNEFLISQRNDNDTFGSFWEFPGGKKMRGETFEQCVAREVMEECGIEIKAVSKLMEIRKKYDDRVIWLNFFLCSYLKGEPKPIDCQKVLWANINTLKSYQFPPANDVVIDLLLERFKDGR